MVAESNSASAASPEISAHKTRARKTRRSIPARVSNLDFLFFKPHFLQARPYYMKSENEKRQIWLQQPASVFNIARWEPTHVLPANTREAGKWGGQLEQIRKLCEQQIRELLQQKSRESGTARSGAAVAQCAPLVANVGIWCNCTADKWAINSKRANN